MRNHSGEKRRRPRRYFATARVWSPFSPFPLPPPKQRCLAEFTFLLKEDEVGGGSLPFFFLGLVGPLDLGALSFLWRGKKLSSGRSSLEKKKLES